MRNLKQYPVTKNELLGYLDKHLELVQDREGKRVGDIEVTLIREVIKIVEEADYEFKL